MDARLRRDDLHRYTTDKDPEAIPCAQCWVEPWGIVRWDVSYLLVALQRSGAVARDTTPHHRCMKFMRILDGNDRHCLYDPHETSTDYVCERQCTSFALFWFFTVTLGSCRNMYLEASCRGYIDNMIARCCKTFAHARFQFDNIDLTVTK